jgi:tetratricopeptide (TPR) repeat protein
MMNWKIVAGIALIIAGVGLYFFYDQYYRPEREAREMISEGKVIFERGEETGDKDSINQSISIFSKVIAKYTDTNATKAVAEAYFQIGKCYEKLKLYRLAYLKYSYVIKDESKAVSDDLRKDILVRLAHINILKQYSEEGVHQLYTLLNATANKDFRGRVYSELGHAYLRSAQYNRAKRMFDISLTESGGNEDAILGKARSLKRMGYDDEAYNTYDYFLKYYGAISQYTKDVRGAYQEQAYWSGIRAYRRGDYSRSISYMNRLLRNFPYEKKSENALYWLGQNYFAMKHFDTAIYYFNRVLSNGYYHKDQDAQIKKGYAYFLSGRFDHAAREFENYLKNYHHGRYHHIATEWKNMSTQEILYRIQNQKQPSVKNEDSDDEGDDVKKKSGDDSDDLEDGTDEPKPRKTKKVKRSAEKLGAEDEESTGDYKITSEKSAVELENVAEL